MYLESKRVFISDLPEELTDGDVTERFSKFGTVSSVEIKQRKDLGPKNNSKYFAFVNIEIDALSLQKCFQEIANSKWKGQYVQLQLARENFLDRLRKEREEAKQNQPLPSKIEPLPTENNVNISKIKKFTKRESIESSTDSSDTEEAFKAPEKQNLRQTNGFLDSDIKSESVEEFSDIVYKSNKSKIVNNKLVIESVGNKPIFTSTIKSKSLDPKRSEADQKRIQSLLDKRQGFNRKKLVIKNALAKIDISSSIVDKKLTENITKTSKKSNLFENDDADEKEYNFNLKKQYEGAKGQKLLALQSNYKNDDRFNLDERFIEEAEETFEDEENYPEDDLFGEKKKEFEIMEQVLGTKIIPNIERQKNKLMLRFDPNQPEHSKYEIKDGGEGSKPAKKQKKETVEVVLPEVSQETFFNVDDNLKSALQEKSSFSLLGMFGRSTKPSIIEDNYELPTKIPSKKSSFVHSENPFKYDSSDDDERQEIVENVKNKDKTKSATISLGAKKLWTETLFFKEDDYRFQDGMEFVLKLGTEETGGISEVRQEIKQIVRAKVRNNKGKDKMFKRKLGGQKKFKFRKSHKKQ